MARDLGVILLDGLGPASLYWCGVCVCVCVCVNLHCRPCDDTRDELHQTCEDIFNVRGQQSRPRKSDLGLVANYAH